MINLIWNSYCEVRINVLVGSFQEPHEQMPKNHEWFSRYGGYLIWCGAQKEYLKFKIALVEAKLYELWQSLQEGSSPSKKVLFKVTMYFEWQFNT